MASVLGTLVVRIAAEMARYKADLDQGIKDTAAAAGQIEQSTQKVGAAARKGFGEAGAAAEQSAQKQVDAARQIEQSAQKQVDAVRQAADEAKQSAQKQVDAVLQAADAAKQSAQKQVDAVLQVVDAVRQAADAAEKQVTAMDRLKGAVKALGLAYAAYKVFDLARDMTMLNARYQELGVVMTVVGKNAGYNAQEMARYAAETQKMGISMLESRNTVIQLAQAEIDLSQASKLARVAQDAAVIGSVNSSQALATMIHGIKSAQTDVLRTIGINVNFEQSYKELAKTLGVSTAALSEKQKMQARENAVMQEGAKLVGTYEASMDTAGKQVRSMTRYVEDLKVMGGGVFNEVLTVAVMGFTEHLKNANKEVSELAKNGELQAWGKDLTDIFIAVANAIDNIFTRTKMAAAWLATQKIASEIADEYQPRLRDASKLPWAQGEYKAISAERDAKIKAAKEAIDEDMKMLGGQLDRTRRAGEERRAAHAETAANIASTEKQYLAAQLVVQKAYADQSVEIQRAAQLALRNGFFAPDPQAPNPRPASTDDKAEKAYASAKKEAEQFIQALKNETQEIGLNAAQVKMLGAARAAAKAPTAALRMEIMVQAQALSLASSAQRDAADAAKANTQAVDDLFDAQEKLRLANEAQIRTGRTMLEQLEFETRLLGLNASERALATMERELERQGIVKGTQAYEAYIEKLREWTAIKGRAEAAAVADRDAAEAWKKSVEQYDDIFRKGFANMVNGGKDSWRSFTRSLATTFKTTVVDQIYKSFAQPFVVKFVASLLGVTGSGLAGAAANAGGTGMAGSAMGSAFSSYLLGGSTLAAIGQSIGTGVMATLSGQSVGAAASAYGAAGMGGVSAGLQVGAAIPYVAAALAVASALGLFRKTKTVGQGISGTFGDETELQNYTTKRKGGSLFRGPRTWDEYSAMDAAMEEQLAQTFLALRSGAVAAADALGLAADSIKSYSSTVRVALGSDAKANEEAVAKMFAGMGDAMATTVAPGIAALAKSGETASATLGRLSSSITVANGWLLSLGQRLFQVSLDGGVAASSLVDVFGGLDQFNSRVSAYYDVFYSEEEKRLNTIRAVNAATAGSGLDAATATRATFRDLVQAQDLTAASGRSTYAALISVAGAFATLSGSVNEAANALREEDFASRVAYERFKGRLLNGQPASAVPGYADGGWHSGGWRVVGERGPELEATGPAAIYKNSQSLFDTAELVAEIRSLRAEVTNLRIEVRTTAVNTGKLVRLEDKWDSDGLPATRA